jgi:hypothetical protein
MTEAAACYLVGIDLGTTNSTLAYTQIGDAAAPIQQFAIPQLVAAGQVEAQPLLPSFIYLPWELNKTHCVGLYARERGGEVPGRTIASAKSWLCHAGIDRRAPLLPITEEGSVPRFSPLEACAAILTHLREAWDHTMGVALAEQQVSITVPASFDPSARQLVQEAAAQAGYGAIVLLEEPQAAFYDWLHRHGEVWRDLLHVGDTVLVVDIGGGTTDFSTISVADVDGNLVLERLAVGSHLLLGGDNFDYALAYQAKDKFEEKGTAIDEWQLQGLLHACRRGKEKLFNDPSAKAIELTVMGRGSRLVGGSIKNKLMREEALGALFDGFLPLVTPAEQSPPERLGGLRQMGLPYAQDGRITCQLAKFLSQTGEGASGSTERFVTPTAVLFNGGTFKGELVRERLLEQLNQWTEQLGGAKVRELPGAEYDCAVSSGAVCYALARQGHALRIKAGTSRSYYVGIEEAAPAVPGRQPPLKAVCVVPYGMEEGSEAYLSEQMFALVLGEEATFRFFSRATPALSDGTVPEVGTWVKNWQHELTELHPIETVLPREDEDGKSVVVSLKSHVTALGVLELWCQAADGREWKLEFDIRRD